MKLSEIAMKLAEFLGLRDPPQSSVIIDPSPTADARELNTTELSGIRTNLAGQRTALADVRSHMANERTHLAQIRTALALMSFGITLNRFSIYLLEKDLPRGEVPRYMTSQLHNTAYVGIGMVVLGILLLFWSLYRYHRVYREIVTRTYTSPRLSVNILTFSIILMGAVSALWMILG